jgi:hypothetical protein
MIENLMMVLRPFSTLYGSIVLGKLFILCLMLNYLYNHERSAARVVRKIAQERARESERNGADPGEQFMGYANKQQFVKHDFKGYMRYYEAKHGKQGKIATWLVWLGFEETDSSGEDE